MQLMHRFPRTCQVLPLQLLDTQRLFSGSVVQYIGSLGAAPATEGSGGRQDSSSCTCAVPLQLSYRTGIAAPCR